MYPVLLASFLLAGCTSTGGTNTTVVALEPTEGTVKVAAEDANGETIVVEYDASEVPASALETTEEAGMVAALPASSEAESESQQVAVQPASAVASSSAAAESWRFAAGAIFSQSPAVRAISFPSITALPFPAIIP